MVEVGGIGILELLENANDFAAGSLNSITLKIQN